VRKILLSLLAVFSSSGFGMTMTIEEANLLSAGYSAPALEETGEYTMAFWLGRPSGFTRLYETYGETIRDRGITEKRPFWYVLRSLLPTFSQEEQARFTALSGISIGDSLVPAPWERILMAQDSKRLLDLHYNLACVGCDHKAMQMKRAWYALAEANRDRTCAFWKEFFCGIHYASELMCIRTFAQMISNASIPGENGLHYLIPDVWPTFFFFFSDEAELREAQMREYCDILDP
jgi:hypothetical protein